MINVLSVHDNIVFFYNSDSILIRISLLLAWHLGGSIILLGLDHVATLHLRILDFNLGIVENVVIVIDVLDDFDWLLLTLLLRL